MEREVLLAKAPHLSWPLRFVLPLRAAPAAALDASASGLWLYDHLDWHMTLPKSTSRSTCQESKFGCRA
jgi:glycerol-3-phosphate dehydrogenase